MLNKLKNGSYITLKMVDTYIIPHSSPTSPNYTWSLGSLVGKFKRYFGAAKFKTIGFFRWIRTTLYKDKRFYYFIFLLARVSLIIPALLLPSIIDWESVSVGAQIPLESMSDNYFIWNNVSIYFDFFLILIFTISAILYWFITNYSGLQIFYVFLFAFYTCLFFVPLYLITEDFNILILEPIIFDTYIHKGDELIFIPHFLWQIYLEDLNLHLYYFHLFNNNNY